MNQKECSVAFMHLDEDGILNIKMKKRAHLTLENIKEYYSLTNELIGQKKVLVMVDGSEEYTMTEEARAYGNGENAVYNLIAIAFVTNSIANRLMLNLHINFNKPVIPTKMFSSKHAAIEWLKTFYIFPGERFKRPKKR